MLKADNISIQFGDERVLRNFSCHIRNSDFACIVGKSGCGKTSLLKSFIGIVPLSEGAISIQGEVLDEKNCSSIRKKVMYLPQELSFPCDTVMDLVMMILRVGKMKGMRHHMNDLQKYMTMLGLDKELLDKRMTEISGGQRQRLVLAILALLNKSVWLLDEPTAALDVVSRNLVIDFLHRLQSQGKTIVAVSHDSYFSSCCSTIISLD